MVEAINSVGHVMGKITIAEFVENDACLRILREIGVDFAQGYGIDRPAPFGVAVSTHARPRATSVGHH
jgi:EAL domain-containing protein (putative c-di-GMP-specific phosphodiesterase class I)